MISKTAVAMARLNVDVDPSNESKSLNYILNGEVESFFDHVYKIPVRSIPTQQEPPRHRNPQQLH
jgi:hypothetical protein